MWGRIVNIAAQMDDSFGARDDANSVATASGEDSAALPADDGQDNGWGDDDFGDDLDFGDEPFENGGEPLENGLNGGAKDGQPSGEQQTPDEGASFVDNDKANDGANGPCLGEQQSSLGEEASFVNDNMTYGGGSDVVVDDLDTKADESLLMDVSKECPDIPDTATAEEAVSSEADKDIMDNADKRESQEIQEEQSPPLPQSLPQSAPPTNDLPEIVTVSAPGKALVAGGYLVLESPNPGVVLAAKGCRFHATVAFQPPHSEGGGVIGNSVDASWECIPLDVYSPQFDKVFSYHLSYSMAAGEDDVSIRLQPRTGPHEPNKFVERSLLLVLGYLCQHLGAGAFHTRLHQRDNFNGSERVALAIKLRADNDFYSQINRLKEKGWDLTPQNLERLDSFLPCPKDESTGELIVNKTGMGSSAALVTSLVGALLRFFGVVSLPIDSDREGEGLEAENEINGAGRKEEEGLRIAHNLSQICHCHAQGKVGSGFDISSAVYGSHVYTRFSKGVISHFLESLATSAKGENDGIQLSKMSSDQLVALVNDTEWDCTVSPLSLPPGLELLMADVCGGSESPSMARKVLDWKKNKRRIGFMDDYYWRDLKRCNKKIVSLLSDQLTDQTFLDGLRRDGAMIVSARTAEQWKKPMPSSWYKFEGSSWDVALKLLDLRMTFLECRQNLKGMGQSAGVPIEPDEQTAVADATMRLPGVVAAGVPGAGGYDALFAIYVKGPETNDGSSDRVRDEIGNFWREMSNENDETFICPLSVRAAGSGDGLYATKLNW